MEARRDESSFKKTTLLIRREGKTKTPCLRAQSVNQKQKHMGLGKAKGLQVLPFPYSSWAPEQPTNILWSQNIQTRHLLENKLPMGLKQPD